MKVSVILVCGTFFLACITDVSSNPPGAADGPASTSSADPADPIPAPLQKFLAGVPSYGQASSFAMLKEVTTPARLFPDYHFFSLVFRMHPIARIAPEPLKEQNILYRVAGGKRATDERQRATGAFFQRKTWPASR